MGGEAEQEPCFSTHSLPQEFCAVVRLHCTQNSLRLTVGTCKQEQKTQRICPEANMQKNRLGLQLMSHPAPNEQAMMNHLVTNEQGRHHRRDGLMSLPMNKSYILMAMFLFQYWCYYAWGLVTCLFCPAYVCLIIQYKKLPEFYSQLRFYVFSMAFVYCPVKDTLITVLYQYHHSMLWSNIHTLNFSPVMAINNETSLKWELGLVSSFMEHYCCSEFGRLPEGFDSECTECSDCTLPQVKTISDPDYFQLSRISGY